MKVVVTVESRLVRTPEGAVWTRSGPSYQFWTRYLAAFDDVRVMARTSEVASVPDDAKRVDGPSVEVWPLPAYLGPAAYLRRRIALGRAIHKGAESTDAAILRVPSVIGSLLATSLTQHGRQYALEVVGDPYDVFAPGAVRHPLRPLLRQWSTRKLQAACASATAVSYVTRQYLQQRYPPSMTALTCACSDIELPSDAFTTRRWAPTPAGAVPMLVSVGSLAQPYKGIDTLIHAVGLLARGGTLVRLTHIGDGRYRSELTALAERLGLAAHISFVGEVPAGAQVRRHLDTADIFVMPSRTEGLPRALIEAMARGLPALGSAVGGIPELLPEPCLVKPDDPQALATRIGQLLSDPGILAEQAARNLGVARGYSSEALTPVRTAFYRAVRDSMQRHPIRTR